MADLAVKLGLQPAMNVCLLDAPTEAEQALRQAAPWVVFSTALDARRFDMILFWPTTLDGLGEYFARLQHCILPDGAVWAVMPKKKYADRRGVSYTWEQLQAAGLQTDLVDNKVASITEEDYGTRFVIRKQRRSEYQ